MVFTSAETTGSDGALQVTECMLETKGNVISHSELRLKLNV
jgi:hypothetical protein